MRYFTTNVVKKYKFHHLIYTASLISPLSFILIVLYAFNYVDKICLYMVTFIIHIKHKMGKKEPS